METDIERLAALLREAPVAVLTGAGVSTDSGIPDYRGAGTPRRNPMRIDQFMNEEAYRQRFWAGARIGSLRTAHIQPNHGHLSLAALEASGRISGVITQNVDDLHNRAGSRTVIELHGNGGVIRCVTCGHRLSRDAALEQFDALNPGFVEQHAEARIAPDGDAWVTGVDLVSVPVCPLCGELLRPDVVYFGETVPREVFARAEQLVEQSSALLLAGTSLAVNTGIRLVHRAERRGIPLAIINRGPTAIDARPSVAVRINAGTSETLAALTDALA